MEGSLGPCIAGVPPSLSAANDTKEEAVGYNPQFMSEALAEAQTALRIGEVPVGCVFVRDGAIIARGHNLTTERGNALEHAELVAIDTLCRSSSEAYLTLEDVDLYVTVEPCIMCGAALLYRRIRRVYYGASNTHFGGNGSVLPLHRERGGWSGGRPLGYESFGGHERAAAVALLQQFYKQENPSAPPEKRLRKEGQPNPMPSTVP